MLRFLIGALGTIAIAQPAAAQVQPFPASFSTRDVQVRSATMHLRAGGECSTIVMRNAAVNVTELAIANSGHWLMEEQPTATTAAIRAFLSPR